MRKYKPLIKKICILLIIVSVVFPINWSFINSEVSTEENIAISDSIQPNSNNQTTKSKLWSYSQGFYGNKPSFQPRLVNFTNRGEKLIALGTEKGFTLVDLDGIINMSYKTFAKVIDFSLIDDISNDSAKDIVLITYDQEYSNVIAISSNKGELLWKFKPSVESLDPNTYEKREFQTYTWDVEMIKDINNDGKNDVVISSWYRIFVLDGKSGDPIWSNNLIFSNDIWKIKSVQDKLIAGSEEGKLVALNIKTGRKIWEYQIPKSLYRQRQSMAGVKEVEVPNSIDDISIIKDVDDDDEKEDLLVSSDDGFIRLISSESGILLDMKDIYNLTIPTDPIYYNLDDSPYSSSDRLFTKAGVKILALGDLNNDGIEEYAVTASNLDYVYNYRRFLKFRIFNIDENKIRTLYNMNWSYNEHSSQSYPAFIDFSSQERLYFYKPEFYDEEEDVFNSPGIYYSKIRNGSLDLTLLYEDDDYSTYTDYYEYGVLNYVLNVGDQNSNGMDDLFAITSYGKYFLIDPISKEIIWERIKTVGESEIKQIQDLNHDGIPDFLYKQISSFNPTWMSSSTEEQTFISDMFTIDAKTGETIWKFTPPDPNLYNGIQDLLDIGDVNDDNITDYATWIIPSTIPTEVTSFIESLGTNSIPNEQIYRTLLRDYTKFLVINGSNGKIIWDKPFIDFLYKFHRGQEGNEFYLRSNEDDTSWYENLDYGNFSWTSRWNPFSLFYPEMVTNVSGIEVSFENFDTFNFRGKKGSILYSSAYDTSAKVITGVDLNNTNQDTEEKDLSYWGISSSKYDGADKVDIEFSFSQPETEKFNPTVLFEFIGECSSDLTYKLYNFNDDEWDASINLPLDAQVNINDENFIDSSNNNQVRIKILGEAQNQFNLLIDLIRVNYTYTYDSYKIDADFIDSFYQTTMNFSVPVDFDVENKLGLMGGYLSQIERLSALKFQTELKVNDTSNLNYYNFTYELYNESDDTWVLCNWNSTLDNWTTFDTTLKGGYGENRTSYDFFKFNKSIRRDDMYVKKLGTSDDNSGGFDYSNPSSLVDFIDSKKCLNIRLNITNSETDFNLTIDTFGVGAFYWGLFSNEYDRYYLLEGNDFTDDTLLDLQIQDCEVINGSGDEYLDVLLVIGKENDTQGEIGYSSKLCLIDVKNQDTITKWSLDKSYIPDCGVRILNVDNRLNNFILCGEFTNGTEDYYGHRKVSNPLWSTRVSHFEVYHPSKTRIKYNWTAKSPVKDYTTEMFEIPKKLNVSENGEIGILLIGGLDSLGYINQLKILDSKKGSILCIINTENIRSLFDDLIKNYDLSISGAGFKQLLSYEDFNGDSYYDHVCITSTNQVKIYDGSGQSNTLFEKEYLNLAYLYDERELDEEPNALRMPFTSIGDINEDGYSEGIIGIQRQATGQYSECKGAKLEFFDIFSSTETNSKELSDYNWILDPFTCTYESRFTQVRNTFFYDIKNLGDLNNDGRDDILLNRYKFNLVNERYWSYYRPERISELVDPLTKDVLFQFNMDIDEIFPIDDLNNDGRKELIITSGEETYCINSMFNVDLVNLNNHQNMATNKFEIKWETDATFEYFDLIINNTNYNNLNNKEKTVSLGAGTYQISICMYDESGSIISLDSVFITVPGNYTFTILTISLLCIFAGLYIYIHQYLKKRKSKVLIHLPKKKGVKKNE